MAVDYLAIGATLVCLLAAVAVYLHRAGLGPFARKEVLSASPFGLPPEPEAHDPDEWMARGLGVELPTADIEAYEAAAEKLKGMKRGSPEVSEAHQLAVNLLMQRACASLLAIWKATREMARCAPARALHPARHPTRPPRLSPQERLFRMRRTNRLSDGEWAGVEEEFEAFREERLSVAEQASWLRPGWPGGWGESVFTDAHRALLRARERMLADGHEPDDERVPPAGRLRFEPGARVQCNVGRDPSGSVKWSCGTVLSSYELPYKVALDEAGRVNAPQAGSHSPAPNRAPYSLPRHTAATTAAATATTAAAAAAAAGPRWAHPLGARRRRRPARRRRPRAVEALPLQAGRPRRRQLRLRGLPRRHGPRARPRRFAYGECVGR